MIAVQRTEHIDLQNMIETGQRNFRDTCKGPEKDFYPKSQNTKVEDPQSFHSIKPELTSVHPYCSTNKFKWKLWILTNTEAIPQKLILKQGLREFQWIIQELMVRCSTRRKKEPVDLWCLTWEIAKPNPHLNQLSTSSAYQKPDKV